MNGKTKIEMEFDLADTWEKRDFLIMLNANDVAMFVCNYATYLQDVYHERVPASKELKDASQEMIDSFNEMLEDHGLKDFMWHVVNR